MSRLVSRVMALQAASTAVFNASTIITTKMDAISSVKPRHVADSTYAAGSASTRRISSSRNAASFAVKNRRARSEFAAAIISLRIVPRPCRRELRLGSFAGNLYRVTRSQKLRQSVLYRVIISLVGDKDVALRLKTAWLVEGSSHDRGVVELVVLPEQ